MAEEPKMPEGANGARVEAPRAPEKQEVPQFEPVIPKKPKKPVQPAPEKVAPPVVKKPAAAPVPQAQKSETLEKIEDIMEDDLAEVYSHLAPAKKQEFRAKGEATAAEIETMLFRVKIKSKKVFKLLFGWMKVIPGVSKYFLEQEAKIKTDEILEIKEDLDRSKSNEMDI